MILVTGANGFVGSALIDHLERSDTPFVAATRSAKIGSGARGTHQVSVGDIDGDTDWSEALKGVHTVLHLAGRAHVMREDARTAERENLTVNFTGSLQLARQAIAAGVQRFVFVSTAKVFGEYSTPGVPFDSRTPARPVGPYARSKLAAEEALVALHSVANTELVIVRPPLVYGPAARGNFARLVKLAKRPVPLPLRGIGNRRTLIYVENLASFLAAAAAEPGARNQILLPGDTGAISTGELVRLIRTSTGVSERQVSIPRALRRPLAWATEHVPVAQRLFGNFELDTSRSNRILNWSPPVKTSDAIRRTLSTANT